MEAITSTLNPFAVSYIPLAKREVYDVDKDGKTMSGEAAISVAYATVDDLKLKSHQADASRETRPEIPQEMDASIMDEETEMDLAYLQMIFPGVSDQSLADVYNVNMGDLEAAVDMLSELESAAEDQPDALNIDSTREPVSSGECSSLKAVKATGDSSTSGSSGVTVATV